MSQVITSANNGGRRIVLTVVGEAFQKFTLLSLISADAEKWPVPSGSLVGLLSPFENIVLTFFALSLQLITNILDSQVRGHLWTLELSRSETISTVELRT